MRLLLAAIVIALATPAAAVTCYREGTLPLVLNMHYQEIPAYAATIDAARTIVIYVSPESGSWTMTMRTTDLNAECLLYAGDDWRFDDERPDNAGTEGEKTSFTPAD